MGFRDEVKEAKSLGSLWKQQTPLIARIARKTGRPPKTPFEDAELLLNGCQLYFGWADTNQYREQVINFYEGDHFKTKKSKLRAYTLEGLCAWLGVGKTAWARAKDSNETLADVRDLMEWAENIIYEQTFTGAASGMLKDGIIIRKLGLADRQETTGKDGGPIVVKADEVAADYIAIIERMAGRREVVS